MAGSISIFYLIVCCSAGVNEGFAVKNDVRSQLPTDWKWSHSARGPVCGVYAVSRALSRLNISNNPGQFWNSNVIGREAVWKRHAICRPGFSLCSQSPR